MKSLKNFTLVLTAFILLSINAHSQEKMPAKEKWSMITMEGTVTEIVKETREITLMGPEGGLVTFTADEAIERFDEIAVNDVITFDYWTYMMAEFREPTAAELAEPIVVVADASKTPEGVAPGAAVGAVVRAIVTIEALNRPYMLAVVKGPKGNYLTIEMADAELITKLNIGQVVILTYAEAVAVSLKKVGADL